LFRRRRRLLRGLRDAYGACRQQGSKDDRQGSRAPSH
jgi:hypothetical protein